METAMATQLTQKMVFAFAPQRLPRSRGTDPNRWRRRPLLLKPQQPARQIQSLKPAPAGRRTRTSTWSLTLLPAPLPVVGALPNQTRPTPLPSTVRGFLPLTLQTVARRTRPLFSPWKMTASPFMTILGSVTGHAPAVFQAARPLGVLTRLQPKSAAATSPWP